MKKAVPIKETAIMFFLLCTGCDKVNDWLLPHEPLSPTEAKTAFAETERAHLSTQVTLRQIKVTDPIVLEMASLYKTCQISRVNRKESTIISITGNNETQCPIRFRETRTKTKTKHQYTYSYLVKDEKLLKLNSVQAMFLTANIIDKENWTASADIHFGKRTIGHLQFARKQEEQRKELFKITQNISILLMHGLLSGLATTDGYIVNEKIVLAEPKCEVNKTVTSCKDLKNIFNESLGFDLPRE